MQGKPISLQQGMAAWMLSPLRSPVAFQRSKTADLFENLRMTAEGLASNGSTSGGTSEELRFCPMLSARKQSLQRVIWIGDSSREIGCMRVEATWRMLLIGVPLWLAVPGSAQSESRPSGAAAVQPAQPDAGTGKAQAAEAKQAEKTKAKEEKMVKKAAAARSKVYTGPNTIIVLPPKPILDEEGKQRLDPDGKPMFYPPVKQQRDKHGHPLFDANGKPVFQTATDLGYDERGKKIRAHKIKPPRMTPMTISRGTLTVDGMIGKAEMNYQIADFKYLYLYAPGIGTLVVSNEPFTGGKEEKGAFNKNNLTVTMGEHMLQLASDQWLLGKNKRVAPAYVMVDREFKLPSSFPVVGYGSTLKTPYEWPGSHENVPLKGAFVQPPPVPVNLRPVMLLKPCPTGEMRKPAPPVLPGQKEVVQPCVPIPKGSVTISKPATSGTGSGAASAAGDKASATSAAHS